MRRVAGEQHIAVTKAVHPQTRECIDAHPLQLELRIRAEQRTYTRNHAFWRFFEHGVRIPAKLEIDAPHIVRLAMQQHRLIRMKRRIEPEPALDGKVRFHLDVGDQEAVIERAAVGVEPHQFANRTVRAVRRHHITAAQRIFPVRRFDRKRDVGVLAAGCAILLQTHHLALPANLEIRQFARSLQQIAFHVVLLKIDESRPVVTALR